jgi:hypothetical protein
MDAQKKAEALRLIREAAPDFIPAVQDIEKSIKTTQNHYGRYASVISQLAKGDKNKSFFYGACLIEAGANRQGVIDALKILF